MAATYLTEDFVEKRLRALKSLQDGWAVDQYGTGKFYELDLKMCQIKDLSYSFEWGKERGITSRTRKLTEVPSKILVLDISLNELIALPAEGLMPFKNLRALDASLNQITSFQGIEVLPMLYSLNLSHNLIRNVAGLINSGSLVELNLSMNNITDLSRMPSMINLRVLNINNNDITSLDGVSSLPKLKELYAQRNNLVSILHLTSCFNLQVLNVADNRIHQMEGVTDVLSRLSHLQALCLHGNPIERSYDYQSGILSCSSVMTLDNISVRPLARKQVPMRDPHSENISSLQEAARQAFDERIRATRSKVDEKIRFLQKRIIAIQDEQKNFEAKMKTDLDGCLRYLGTLTDGEVEKVKDKDTFSTEFPTARDGMRTYRSNYKRDKNDYTGVKDTDEVLRCAYNELSGEQSTNWEDI
ncbi:hypothetical protein LOTGIDRAFT_232290 [Lottia gigantea]|uniref:Uncharacterized protein n=1 Tax=Lottia gigantea TaxID=225164 RepID=V4AH09_LOTGI|nr:hypothetical protein LOTGIDRAFT_232290 [Lottia gigantea]ESO94435.1 hypothetical protein LOTGIDRAFT_232290 [Lottia gigantea]